MKLFKFIIIFQIILSSSPHWLIEFDCEKDLNFFEIHTLNTYNLNNCDFNQSICGEYINLMYHSVFHNNKVHSGECELQSRKIEYSLKPVNMAGSIYDSTPHFIINLKIDNREVIKELPLFPSPLYDKSLWGLKIASIRYNNNTGSIEVMVSDDELYPDFNPRKLDPQVSWLWDSNYISAFDPEWKTKWKPIIEKDIWNENKFKTEGDK